MQNLIHIGLLKGCASALATVVFLIDAFTPFDFAIAVLYVLVILLVALTGSIPATRSTAAICAVLTVAAYGISPHHGNAYGHFARCVFALLAISTTALLALRNLSDMKRRRQAEAALARSEAFLAEAQKLSKTGSIAIRLPDGTMACSDEAYRILGYPPVDGMHFGMVLSRVHVDDLMEVQRVHAAMLDGVPAVELTHRLCLPDGAVRHVHLVARRTSPCDSAHEYVGALMDVTDATLTQQALHRTMSELAHVARVSTLGQLAASIAHEVTQPITAIVSCGNSALRWLNRTEPNVAEGSSAVEQMIRDAGRASDIIRQIRAMAQKSEPNYVDIPIDRLVTSSLEVVKRELQDHHIAVELVLNTDKARIRGDWTQLQQVLINLLINAAQAMEGAAGRRRLTIASRTMPDQTVLLVVSDTGPGISPEGMARLFQAFYSTKANGMGIGLSICRGIVEAHGGDIAAESPPEGGARLIVRLPLIAVPRELPGGIKDAPAPIAPASGPAAGCWRAASPPRAGY